MSRATLLNMRANTRNVTCEGVLFTVFWSLPATTLVPHTFLVFSCVCCFPPHLLHRYLFAAAHHSVRCVFASIWIWSKFFTIFSFFRRTVEASCTLLCCMNFLPFLLNRSSSHLRYFSSVQHRSFFCWHIRFFITFSDALFEWRRLLLLLLGRLRFDVLDLDQYAFLINSV